jgi:cell fate regulator YaaT (PSP1 superfamily)
MGCGSCGTGKPNGCKSNGGCSTGGCNRLNVFDWLANLPFSDPESSCRLVEVSFNQGSRKEFYRNTSLQYYEKGAMVAVEGVGGFDVGEVSLSGELVRLQLKKRGIKEDNPDIKRILRRASSTDLEKLQESKSRERDILIRSRAMARQLNLQMKLAEVEVQADGKKGTFFYTADDRVDFRELIKLYANDFRLRVEMKQIGARQEAAKVGGIGSCGRELCCSTWLHDFKSVNTTAARYQNLSINQTKLSGQCGRLKCCLNYELDTYLDALQFFPDNAEVLETAKGRAMLAKKDIFKNLMWYTLPQSNKQYPLTLRRVREIQAMNAQGQVPDDLQAVEVLSAKVKEAEPEFVDVVGHISLRSLERTSKRQKEKERQRSQPQQPQQTQQPRQQGQQPQGQPRNRPGGQQPPQQGQQPRQNQQQPRGNQPQQQRRPQQGGGGGNRPQQQGGPRPNKPNRPPQNNGDPKPGGPSQE